MKAKGSNKLHLLEVAAPLNGYEGRYPEVLAECGYQFHLAEHKWSFAIDSRPNPAWWETLNPLTMCRECFNIVRHKPDAEKGRYLYALVEAESQYESEVA